MTLAKWFNPPDPQLEEQPGPHQLPPLRRPVAADPARRTTFVSSAAAARGGLDQAIFDAILGISTPGAVQAAPSWTPRSWSIQGTRPARRTRTARIPTYPRPSGRLTCKNDISYHGTRCTPPPTPADHHGLVTSTASHHDSRHIELIRGRAVFADAPTATGRAGTGGGAAAGDHLQASQGAEGALALAEEMEPAGLAGAGDRRDPYAWMMADEPHALPLLRAAATPSTSR
jgi:hypothetical protein